MAETTEFNHDQFGPILADHLVEVPEFQRSFSWERLNVQEYLTDLHRAREKKSAYFMGTLVFAKPNDGTDRRKIVDGQQRLATTAILFVAIRDRLADLGRDDLAESTTTKFLRRFSIQEEGEVDSLILSKNRYGKVYPYFICVGRRMKRGDCAQRAVLIDVAAARVEDYCGTVQLGADEADGMHAALSESLAPRETLPSTSEGCSSSDSTSWAWSGRSCWRRSTTTRFRVIC